jgi:hypothetical protein
VSCGELRRPTVAGFAVALLLALTPAGCGGGSDDASSTGGTVIHEGEAKPARPEPSPIQQTADGQESHFEGSEEKLEEFGSEAGGSEQDAVLTAERGYLEALAHRDYDAACPLLSKGLTRSLQALVEGRSAPCRAILPRLLSPTAARVSAQQARGEVMRVRLEGDRAIVIFRAPGARLWALPLSREGDDWKVSTLSASILAPSAATLGE